MKKYLLTVAIATLSIFAQAQDGKFKPFKVDFALGYTAPQATGSKGGGLFSLEPKYALNDNISLGLRIEAAILSFGFESDGETSFTADVKAMGSYLITGDYYLNTSRLRPFVGAGAGIFMVAAAQLDDQPTTEDFENVSAKFGLTPRVGLEASHFRLAVEYNLVPKTRVVNNNYLGAKIGFFLGGGRR